MIICIINVPAHVRQEKSEDFLQRLEMSEGLSIDMDIQIPVMDG